MRTYVQLLLASVVLRVAGGGPSGASPMAHVLSVLRAPGDAFWPLGEPERPLAGAQGKIAFFSTRDGDHEIFVMNADGTGAKQLTRNSAIDVRPAWSPDGTRIAFATNRDGDYEIYVMNANGTGQTNLTNSGADDLSPAWSPDGTQIAFATYRDGNHEVYVMNTDGSGQTNVSNDDAGDLDPAWSPDGSKIAFASSRDGNWEIYTMDAGGGGALRLTNSGGLDVYPAWSPDGGKIAFESQRDGNAEIYVMGADGSGQTRLTSNKVLDDWPTWSPDGNKIAFHSARDGNWELYTMNADGSEQTRLTDDPAADDAQAAWWPRGLPSLKWCGEPGYEADGCDPDSGDPNASTFTFKVKYTDPTGIAPLRARCLLQRKTCGGAWMACRSLALTKESGEIWAGATYSASVTLPNLVYKYRFYFRASTGIEASGDPTAFQQGPLMVGRPWVCWTGAAGFEADGADPDSGPLGTRFRFQVRYSDSAGEEPTTANLVIRRDGRIFRQKTMSAASGGDFRLGKVYRTSLTLSKPGTYEYRFSLADASGNALGPPSNWTAGPTITGSGSTMVTSLAAAPTRAGAQVTFSLSSAANVTATVLNVAGRPIRTIVADKPLEAGLQTLLWDRRAETGLAAPAGLYLIRVTARSEDGGQSTALATVALR